MTKRDPRHDILFDPVQIGSKTIRNRFYAVPHSAGMGVEKPRSQAAFRGMKAQGGWGAVCNEFSPVSYDSDTSPSLSSHMWDDEDARCLQLMCESVHEHGALAGIELTHLGGSMVSNYTRWPTVAPSAIPVGDPTLVPKAMSLSDIQRVQSDWVDAAKRARDAGFDIIYVMATDLPMQFLSPYVNQRQDQYGGSFENRARFYLETLERVRDAVGSDCAIATRMGIGGMRERGVTNEEGLQLIAQADPLIDLWDVNIEVGDPAVELGASRGYPQGFQRHIGEWVRQATTKPIVGVGRLTDPDVMVDLIKAGVCDLIGGARPSIADPFLPQKIREGRYDDIRECIGCNMCAKTAEFGAPHLNCTQNATAGEEFRRGWNPEVFGEADNNNRNALIVGGGPAGMECAIVLAKRGFDNVHLVESRDELGGHMRWVRDLPGLQTWSRVVEWRASQLQRLKGVTVALNRSLDLEGILDYGADLVVMATGSTWSPDPVLEQLDLDPSRVLLPEQIMDEGLRPEGSDVMVYDLDGYYVGVGLAELLASEGYSVSIVTPGSDLAPRTYYTGEAGIIRPRLRELGVSVWTGRSITRFADGSASLESEFEPAIDVRAESLVVVSRRTSDDHLYLQLSADPEQLEDAGIESVYQIGDCVAPRVLADAIFDGHRLGREIDSANPAVPKPHRRERFVLVADEEGAAESERVSTFWETSGTGQAESKTP
ncbi:FAD-dependent oxidoreductase [Nocardioides sp. QY071]|uniref:oxidoreductase n=1 Tax=Nocardioides sp. QY071 TaxID=3044187 RepID=UPI00249C237F|nr:FAD-dependent oxidoreductase [Nocardioides sp. QY071]WGY01684.1 FAD-dependent oxidoreductase [Nocardioides sp. QY071]